MVMNSQKRPRSDAGALIRELESLFARLRRLEGEADATETEAARAALVSFKRGAVEQVNSLMPVISNLVLDSSVREPGILDQYAGLWLSVPEPRQTSWTWGPYVARLREVLLQAVGAASATGVTGKADRHAEALNRLVITDGEPERASSESARPGRAAVQKPKETFTVKELAERWSLGESTIRRLFRDEPGVLRIPHSRRRGKRDYVSLRIPASIAARVQARMSRSLFRAEVE
jgi:hypothetical protein